MLALGCIQALQRNKNTCRTGITTHDKKLQPGLDPENKATRVAQYARNIQKEVGVIAHACGFTEPRERRMTHARIVLENGRSLQMDKLYAEESTVAAS